MAAHAYQHSSAFASLKGITEQIPHNLTSVEYLKTLDTLVNNALYAILSCSRHVDIFLGKILAWQSTHSKRKTASLDKKDLPAQVAAFLIQSSPEGKLETYQNIGFDRGITFELIRIWLRTMAQYEALADDVTETGPAKIQKMHKVLAQANVFSHEDAYVSYLQCQYWTNLAYGFKGVILEKYTRMILMIAQQDYVRLEMKVQLDDIIQEYTTSALKAIDRCDATKGVLTTHIQFWLRSARNVVVKKYINNNEVSIEDGAPSNDSDTSQGYARYSDNALGDDTGNDAPDTELEEIEERKHKVDRIRQIARFFDPSGCARLLLGVSEYPTPTFLRELRS